MKIRELSSAEQMGDLRSAWDTLLSESASDTIFLTWEWTTAWWRAYGQPEGLRLLAAYDDAGALRGIAPLRSQMMRRYGQTVCTLTFLTDGSNDSDYLDFIAARGCEKEVAESFYTYLRQELMKGTVLLLNETPESSPNLQLLKNISQSAGLSWEEEDVPCGTVKLGSSWEEYLGSLKPRFRTKVRSVVRTFENNPDVQFGFCESYEEAKGLLPILFELHTKRWSQEAKPGVFRLSQKCDFYFELTQRLLERGWLRLSWLKWKGRILACQYGFRYSSTYFQLQEGYEPEAEHLNLGIGLRAWSVRSLLKEGVVEYDFLGGIGRHKTDWGAEIKNSKRVVVCKPTYKNVLFCRGPKWETRTKESVARILPATLLSIRRRAFERRQLAAFGTGQGGENGKTPRDLVLKTAANFYIHSPLPAVVRPLLERYQLDPTGRFPFRWKRRSECSARILCYHRVNDSQNPFLPATSTAVFERQMQVLARSHEVVGLTDLMQRLENGPAGAIVAITFDDGYQDNYWSALPILRRYGLPATIFLTTGALDSREPLWFEKLADALNRTTREWLDIEIDIPRRFRLQTEAERLQANRSIFSLLRNLPDTRRKEALSDILCQLGASHTDLSDEMLTWDQVREMSRHRIEFGGHTVTHPFLSKISGDFLDWELRTCKQRIETELQQTVEHFAYPNGKADDFRGTKDAVRQAGYRAAFTTIWGANLPHADRLELRRGGPWEEDAALFGSKLDWYQMTGG